MGDEIEKRLAATAEAHRAYQLTNERRAELYGRVETVSARVAELQARLAAEERDVEQLEGISLTRVLASLRGSRDDALARERAEADLVRYRLAEAQAQLASLRTELGAADARLAELATAPQAYVDALLEKERILAASTDPRGVRLLELAAEHGLLTGETHEIIEALQAAQDAWDALLVVERHLLSAARWSAYDTWGGGGIISSSMKHSRMDEAAQAAAEADRRLGVLRMELADVPGGKLSTPGLAMTELTRFVDAWFDNIFTDIAVRSRIKQAQANVEHSLGLVHEVHGGLLQRVEAVRERLDGIDAERTALITSG